VIQELHSEIEKINSQYQKGSSYPRAIVLQAEGPVFSAGHDLKELYS
jgi:enoyl-CoA hydratase/carnithine racemase